MSIGPILPGRIPPTLVADRLRQNLQRGNRLLVQFQDQLATGQKFFLPSDSPSAALRSILLQRTIERQEQLQSNVQADRSFLVASESALASVSDALNQAKSALLSGIGDSVSQTEKEALAQEVGSLVQQVINAGNTRFRGRYLFGGSESQQIPFEQIAGGVVRYNGDGLRVDSFIDVNRLLANNIDGASAFLALTTKVGSDIDPALSLETKIADLRGGFGIDLGPVTVTIDDTVNPVQTETVDLSGAETLGDIKTLLEVVFAGGPPTLTVEIDPATKNGLRLTPSGGTVAVSDVAGSAVAADLGIASGPETQIIGSDLDPRLTAATKLSDLNGGAGIGTAGNGVRITNGPKSGTVDISSAVTIEDLINAFENAKLDLDVAINDEGNGLSISSRLSGANFSIGEDEGTHAADLGIRTFDGSTLLSELNLGQGVPLNDFDEDGNPLPALLELTRRDGSNVSVDLHGLTTVQEVIDAINAVDPGVLVASLNSVGNGISIVDDDGVSTGPLIVQENVVSTALGMAGEEAGTDPTVPLVGKDVHPLQSEGVLSLLVQLQSALKAGDDLELDRLDALIDQEIERFNLVRGEIGARLQTLDEVENRLLDEEVSLQQFLSKEFDADLAEVVTQVSQVTAALQATLAVGAQTLQLSLLNFL